MNKLLAEVKIGETFFGTNTNILNSPSVGIAKSVSVFLKISFVAAGLVLLFFFILGGIGLISGAGQSDPQKAEQSKKTITSAVIGFVIVFASYWIVKLIGQFVGVTDLI